MIGNDSLNGKIQKMADEMGLRHAITFTGMLEHGVMINHYTWADILIQSSQSEGQGVAVAEAAACGVLLAGTRVGLLSDLGDKAAIVVDVGDDENLAIKLLAIAQNPEEWDSKVRHAKEWVENHPFEKTITRLVEILNS